MENKLIGILDSTISILGMIAMGAMTAGVIISVIFRYFFSLTAAWSEELIGLLFVASSFSGCVIAVKKNEHIGIDLLYEKFGERGKRRFRLGAETITILVQILVFHASLGWIAVSGNVASPGLEIPFAYIYALLPVSCLLIALYTALKFREDLKSTGNDKAVRP